MKSQAKQVPMIEMDFASDPATARLMVSGIDEFVFTLKAAHEKWFASRCSGSMSELLNLVEHCLSISNALPSGLRLALRATRGSNWKKPLQQLQREIGAWRPARDDQFERPTPGIWDLEETLRIWKKETDCFRNSAEIKKEQHAINAITDSLAVSYSMLAQMSHAAELRLLGRPPDSGSRKKEDARSTAEARLAEEFLRKQWLIDILKSAIENGDNNALRIARQIFGRNKLAKQLNIAAGTLSESHAYAQIKSELRLSHKLSARIHIGLDSAANRQSRIEEVSADAHLLLQRLERCLDGKLIPPDICDVMRNEIVRNESRHDHIERVLDRVERGEPIFV